MKQRILFASLALLLLAACHKEPLDPRMEIFVENMQGSAKLALNGVNATWNNGDTLRLNGTRVVVERSGDHAYISNAASQSTNRALFPTRLVASGPSADAVTVSLPREYDYRSNGSHQLLDLPLAAHATDGGPLHFKHLTGALCFMLTNSTGNPLTIDRITVSSNSYQLSGERSINLTTIGSLGPAAGSTDADRTVGMTFTRQSLEIPASGTANVVLPIAPVGSDNIFTVTVVSHYQGNRYTYTKTQGAGKPDRSLARNEIGYVGMILDAATPLPLFAGEGRVGNPYIIATPTDFLLMAEAITDNWSNNSGTLYGNTYFRIDNDIYLNGLSIYPISNFTQQLDGNNHTIYNLTINSRGTSSYDTCALFSYVNGGSIKNLTLDNLTLKQNNNPTGYMILGGFCGSIKNTSILNCTLNNLNLSITGNISSATTYIGGIAARATKANTLTNCIVTTSVSFNKNTSAFYFGNIIGHCNDGGTDDNELVLTNCDATNSSLSISTNNNLTFGGIVGYITKEYLTITGSNYSTSGNLTSTNTLVYAGGIVGRYLNSSTGKPCRLTVSEATLTGSITASGSASSSVGTYLGKSYDSYELHINEGGDCNSTGFSITLNN